MSPSLLKAWAWLAAALLSVSTGAIMLLGLAWFWDAASPTEVVTQLLAGAAGLVAPLLASIRHRAMRALACIAIAAVLTVYLLTTLPNRAEDPSTVWLPIFLLVLLLPLALLKDQRSNAV